MLIFLRALNLKRWLTTARQAPAGSIAANIAKLPELVRKP
jgi:hypothetical protein